MGNSASAQIRGHRADFTAHNRVNDKVQVCMIARHILPWPQGTDLHEERMHRYPVALNSRDAIRGSSTYS